MHSNKLSFMNPKAKHQQDHSKLYLIPTLIGKPNNPLGPPNSRKKITKIKVF